MIRANPWRTPEKPARRSDRRYHTARWQRTRLRVLKRDGRVCYVPDCQYPGDVADHIEEVYAGMPDSLFFAESNLRACCWRHNRARAYGLSFGEDVAPSDPMTTRSIYSKPRIG